MRLGCCKSASTKATFNPAWDAARARCIETVDRPTPRSPLVTARILSPLRFDAARCWLTRRIDSVLTSWSFKTTSGQQNASTSQDGLRGFGESQGSSGARVCLSGFLELGCGTVESVSQDPRKEIGVWLISRLPGGYPRNILARSALFERSPDGLIGLGWIWYFHRCRSCDGARRWRDANRFVLLSDGRVSLPGEFGCRVSSRLDRHRNGIVIPIAIGKVDRFALSQKDHVTRVERRCSYCV